MSLKRSRSLISGAEQQHPAPALPESRTTGTSHHLLRGPEVDSVRCGELTKTQLPQPCHNPTPSNVKKHQPGLSLFPTFAPQAGSPSQNAKLNLGQASQSSSAFSPRPLGSLRGQATVVSCPCTPGQQCALSTQGGVGRAAYGAAPRSMGPAQGSSHSKQEIFANTQTN